MDGLGVRTSVDSRIASAAYHERYGRAPESYRCSVCGKSLPRRETKLVLPSAAYGAMALPLEKRISCVGCYNGLLSVSRAVVTRSESGNRRIKRVRQHMARSMVGRQVSTN